MSHVEEVEVECDDLDSLKAAVAKCGGEFMEGQRTHAWWGTWLNDWRDPQRSAAVRGIDPTTFGKCDHAIRMRGRAGRNGASGPWEIGVTQKSNGKWSLVYDNYGRAGQELEKQFGRDCLKLVDYLAEDVAQRQLIQDGWRVTTYTEPDGTLVVETL
jgi:hypothetical protein